MSSKSTLISLELIYFCFLSNIQLTDLIEEHLDLSPTTMGLRIDSTYLHKSLPKIATLVGP